MELQCVDLNDALDVAVNAAKEAGKVVLEGFNVSKKVEIKTDYRDLVTEYDRKSEDIIISEIMKKYPSHRFIAEESTAVEDFSLTPKPTWFIDPIDGTTNYVHGLHEACISIAMAIDSVMKIGVVYNPILNNTFTACKGQGAFQDGKRIFVSKCTSVREALIAGCVSRTTIEKTKAIAGRVQGFRALGSAALALCYVANGSLDAYVEDGLHCYDVAAGALLVVEAGGTMLSSDGGCFDLMGRKCMATCTQPLSKELLNILQNEGHP